MIDILPKLTKEYLLDNIGFDKLNSQAKIFAYFLDDTDIEDIYDNLNSGGHLYSGLRPDNNPTCSFYVHDSGTLRYRDWAGYFWGDCFDAVGYKFYLLPSDSVDFNKILHIIAAAFKVHKYRDRLESSIELVNTVQYFPFKGKRNPVFDVYIRDWDYCDDKYWGDYYINQSKCLYYNVYPLHSLFINRNLVYTFSYNDIGYAFKTITKEKGEHWECYFPMRKKSKGVPRFLRNHSHVSGLNKIKEAEFGLITKSRKDLLVARNLGIQVCHLAGESVIPKEWELNFIFYKWKKVFCLLDFDETGIRTGIKLKKLGVIPLFFTNGRYGTYDFGTKDLSDFVKEYGYDKTKELVLYIRDEGLGLTNDFYDFINYLLR